MRNQDDITDTAAGNEADRTSTHKEKLEWPDYPASEASFSHGKITKGVDDVEQRIIEAGEIKYHRVGWVQLTVLLVVEAIALGALSLPSAFATLGMAAGVICTVGIGLLAVYTSDIIGQVKLAHPSIRHYGDAGTLIGGRFGYEVLTAMLVLSVVFVTGSHCLTGTIAFRHITGSDICSLLFGGVSAIILLLLSIPSSFADMAWLGYVDFASIVAAIGITIIATGIQSSDAPGGLSAVNWSAVSQGNPTFAEGFIAITNIVFAYSFATTQFSFMDEMHTPKDYKKSIWALGFLQIAIYTITGATIYAFVGPDVESPALLSAGPLISKIAFGVALPVIFISGAINTIVAGRLIHQRIYTNSVTKYINTTMGWITWLTVITVITVIAWVIAEAIPFFSDLLSIASAIFTSGFSFYLPPVMWYMLLRKGKWYSRENLLRSIVNGLVFLFGLTVLVGGLYSSIADIRSNYKAGKVHGPFTCGPV
ncbi:transmembrane amino acid transporter protein-domain-containing protein [Aspergillus pseudonomiae]|uniref:Transmembrane amino acid transporter protein-domain-containing protein n=1 Tax=Aspergillus pseudonomiae TaxID=1506151 RepID=A0A5N7DFI8_9EURO|nr:transmembrane amino acid transporter protein-domain-containing protein [Aspergillus pseudonomiae]KAB8259216.1 transmembrane amino acid transporter protein-domain-containing protein [Aspergillus pseudonomiae]KAE8404965.1 transmembrane amino acid transporter protein-domain-containing protein [Aspergillus pseudonomiae]